MTSKHFFAEKLLLTLVTRKGQRSANFSILLYFKEQFTLVVTTSIIVQGSLFTTIHSKTYLFKMSPYEFPTVGFCKDVTSAYSAQFRFWIIWFALKFWTIASEFSCLIHPSFNHATKWSNKRDEYRFTIVVFGWSWFIIFLCNVEIVATLDVSIFSSDFFGKMFNC